jgi:hypothetical protein
MQEVLPVVVSAECWPVPPVPGSDREDKRREEPWR